MSCTEVVSVSYCFSDSWLGSHCLHNHEQNFPVVAGFTKGNCWQTCHYMKAGCVVETLYIDDSKDYQSKIGTVRHLPGTGVAACSWMVIRTVHNGIHDRFSLVRVHYNAKMMSRMHTGIPGTDWGYDDVPCVLWQILSLADWLSPYSFPSIVSCITW